MFHKFHESRHESDKVTMDGFSSSHKFQKESQPLASSSSSREVKDEERDIGMKGLGHSVSKRDPSPIKGSLDKKAKLGHTEEPMVDRCQKPFSSLSLSEVLFLEIFAGSARLTQQSEMRACRALRWITTKQGGQGHTLQFMT